MRPQTINACYATSYKGQVDRCQRLQLWQFCVQSKALPSTPIASI